MVLLYIYEVHSNLLLIVLFTLIARTYNEVLTVLAMQILVRY